MEGGARGCRTRISRSECKAGFNTLRIESAAAQGTSIGSSRARC